MDQSRTRNSILVAVIAAAVSALFAPDAMPAETYPSKPIRFLVGFPPGGANDFVARAMAARLSPRLGQQLVVENRPGANGNIAHQLTARAAPDGYTMVLASAASLSMSPAMYRELPFDPLNDFAPITQTVGVSSLISIHPSLPPRSVKELVALAKKQPGKLNFGTPGTGSIAHLAAELFLRTAGINMVHVPYKGGGPAVIDAMAGQIECLISLMSTAGPQVKAGKLRGLGVTSPARQPSLPDVPTVAESGYPGFEASGWLGLAFPAKTPAAIVDRIHKESVAVLNTAEVRKQLEDVGLDPAPSSPEVFQAYIKAEHAKWEKLIRAAGIKAE
jgi:tripartite-type tricarboxylate transporter receptor subunit TctC